jgi:hypothetical protein
MLGTIQAKPWMASPDPFLQKDTSMPRPLSDPPARTALREPLPDPVELLRLAFDGLGQPLAGLERWFDRVEGAR